MWPFQKETNKVIEKLEKLRVRLKQTHSKNVKLIDESIDLIEITDKIIDSYTKRKFDRLRKDIIQGTAITNSLYILVSKKEVSIDILPETFLERWNQIWNKFEPEKGTHIIPSIINELQIFKK